jgi:hypothetical protein
LQNATADFLDELEACVGQIQPLSLRHSLLDWLEHADSCKDLNQGFARRLLVLFGRPRFDSKRGAELLIQRADLYRVFGMPENARVEGFRAVETDSFLLSWRLNLARLRLGLDTQFGDLLHQSAKSSFVDTPLYNAVRIGAAVEALRASDSLLAETLMKDIVGKETEQLPIAWETRRASLMEEVSKSAGVEAQTSEKPGDTIGPEKSRHPPTLESTAITISDKDLPPSLAKAASSPEFTIDRLSADWLSFASELQMVLRARGQTGPIQAIGPVAALPWELAGVPHRQSAKAGQPRGPAGSPNEPGTIRLIIAGEGELEAGFAPDSGSSLESVYFGLGLKPSISYSPDPDTILKELLSSPFPVLLHIVAAMRESSGGLYLDFAGGVHRAESFAGSSDAHELLITPFRLDRMLTSLPNPPFVILDITRPYNFTEGLRMLLQRNLFSTQLFELGHVRGILGCGLASPSERVMLSSLIVEALTHDTVGSPVTRLATSGIGDLNYVLPRMAAALWTNEPNERLFIR